MARRKTWSEKYAGAPAAHVTRLDKPFAGVSAGARLFIATPAIIERHVRAVSRGKTLSITGLRANLAREADADATCPLTTSIYLKIIAEMALEAIARGDAPSGVAPFWRVVAPTDALAKKISCGPDFIRSQRQLETGA